MTYMLCPSLQQPVPLDKVTTASWFVPLSEPIGRFAARRAARFAVAIIAGNVLVKAAPFPETVTESRWHQAFSEPRRDRVVARGAIARAASGNTLVKAAPFPETIPVDRWLLAWEGPVRSKRGLRAAAQPTLALGSPPATVAWFAALNEPVRRKAGLHASRQMVLAFAPQLSERDTEPWFVPLAEPVRQKPGLAASRQQATTDYALTQPEAVSVDRWLLLWEGPKRFKCGLGVWLQPDLALNATTPTPAALSVAPSTGLSSSGTEGGPFTPTSETYTLSNGGSISLDFTVTVDESWVALSAASGTLGSFGSDDILVSINSTADALAAGAYTAIVTFTNTTNSTGNTTRSVTLTVTAAPSPWHLVPNASNNAWSVQPAATNDDWSLRPNASNNDWSVRPAATDDDWSLRPNATDDDWNLRTPPED